MFDELRDKIGVSFEHRVHFARDVLDPGNNLLAACLDGGTGTLAFIDTGLLRHWPGLGERVEQYLRVHDLHLAGPVQRVPGGERCKNDPGELDRVLEAINSAGLDRHSHVLVLGGGAVLDCVGWAAAIAHRGMRLVRMPSTTLAQDDAGVGVKNGVNRFGKKNYLGTFAVPKAVINDETLLSTLPTRHWRAGFSEAVKVALLQDASLLERIERDAGAIDARDMRRARPVLRRTAELHLRHIVDAGDPFEAGSARPLDFGHWSAHRLEHVTRHALSHGEAVAIGIALDVTYAELARLMPPPAAQRVRRCLMQLGLPIFHERLCDTATLMRGLEEFREHLGGELTIPMLRDIGDPIDVHEIDAQLLQQAVAVLMAQASGVAGRVGSGAE